MIERFSNDDITSLFEDMGYHNVEIIGDRLIFTTGEDICNWSIEEAIKFLQGL